MFKNLLNRILPTQAPPPPPVPVTAVDDIAGADAAIVEGNALEDAGQLAQAEALYRVAVAKAPGHARAHLNLGIALAARDDTDGAAAAYEKVLAIDPAHPFGNYNHARLAFVLGDLQRARSLVAAALRAKPDFPQALVVQSNVLDALGEATQAIAAMESALQLQPDDAGAWFNLAVMLQKLARNDEAEVAVTRALAGDPVNTGALSLHARLLRDQGFADEALAPLRTLADIDPTNWISRSSELLLMIHASGIAASEILRRHVEFGADLERAVPARFEHGRERGDPQRRLRVGYLSRDFHMHPVSIFLIPMFEQHDRSQVEVFCYSYGSIDDVMTKRLRQLSDHWREAEALSDAELADAIHADGIDVLVDLVGHTGIPRLGVFAQKPAPVQVSWLGYLETTGLTRMDFRLCDRRTDPIELAQPQHTERLVHLPVSQWCYRPMVDEPVDAGPPVEKNGYVTFGSFNSALKISPMVCRRWGEVLARLPGSRLIVANVNSERKRAAIRREIASAGVAGDRVEFLARVPLNQYPKLYKAVDIALDTFPYGGGTTTFDSLWMGVPVLTALGETSVSRSASSILAELGLDDWIAPTFDDYVDVAVARASDAAAIATLRSSLRERLQASPLTDMQRFARDLEAAYRQMWSARSG
jgi:predicted O-linked N-acetylglucosamine transferase (SPINDLY family)